MRKVLFWWAAHWQKWGGRIQTCRNFYARPCVHRGRAPWLGSDLRPGTKGLHFQKLLFSELRWCFLTEYKSSFHKTSNKWYKFQVSPKNIQQWNVWPMCLKSNCITVQSRTLNHFKTPTQQWKGIVLNEGFELTVLVIVEQKTLIENGTSNEWKYNSNVVSCRNSQIILHNFIQRSLILSNSW